jgi:hypothetical protein
VNVAKDVETRLDAPHFLEQMRVADTEIHVMFLTHKTTLRFSGPK